MNLGNLLFNYQGRMNRAKYWLAVLVYFIGIVIIVAVYFADETAGWIVGAIIYLAMIVSGVMVGIKRLHDRDKTGWWLLVFYAAPAALSGGSLLIDDEEMLHTILSIGSFVFSVWALIELGCLRGTIGPNQYGPDPIAPDVLTPPVHTH